MSDAAGTPTAWFIQHGGARFYFHNALLSKYFLIFFLKSDIVVVNIILQFHVHLSVQK
mgnify:CR=1 FL=1